MAAAETASYSAKVLKQEFRKALSLAQAQKSSPLTHIHTGIKNAQRMMNDAAGEKFRDLVASQIYYRALEGSSIAVKNSGILLNAINPDVMDKSVEQIKQSPAFHALAAMKDDQLRLLAQDGDGGKLMDKFFLEAAKSKKANAAQQPNQNAAEAEHNMDIPNMRRN